MNGVGGVGGSESNMKTQSWCSNCRRISAMMVSAAPSSHSSSTYSWRGGNSLLKVSMSLAMLVLLFSIYQNCAPSHESTLPVWLSLSFVSRPSFILSSPELSQQPQERPTSRLVETLAPVSLDPKLSSLFPADASSNSGQERWPSQVQAGDDKDEERDKFEAHNGSLSSLQGASDSGESESSVTQTDSPQDPIQRPLQDTITSDVSSSSVEKDFPVENVDPVEVDQQVSNSTDSTSSAKKDEIKESEAVVLSETTSIEEGSENLSDSSSSSVEKDEDKDNESTVLSETTLMEGANVNASDVSSSSSSSLEKDEVKESETMITTEESSGGSTKDGGDNEGKISDEGGLEKDQFGLVVLSNSSQDTEPGPDGAIRSVNIVLPGEAPAVPSVELELSQAALSEASVDTQLAIPSQITEKPMDERRVKLEEQLHAARRAIEEATLDDSDPSLYRVIYHNISTFSKSYKLMEEMFKIYVYKDGKPPLVHTGPLIGIYASEGRFIDRISKGSSFIVQDPEQAHMFYLPYSVTQMTLTIYVEGSHSMQPLNDFITGYVDGVAAKYPFWNRTRGTDHFFVSCHDWGPATARNHEELRNNAVKVVCNADLNEEYVLGKDVSLPEIYLHYLNKPVKVGGPGAVRRSFLAFFAGQMHGHVRPILIKHWKDKDPDMKIYEVLPKAIERKMNYIGHMKNSKYCICAAGFEVNSPRIVESIYYDCVPVIIADNFVLPFSDILNWSTFSVTIPESEIPNLKSILLRISDRQYKAMQKRLSKVRQHFLWHDEPVKYDVFHMIMHSVWMSRLNRLAS